MRLLLTALIALAVAGAASAAVPPAGSVGPTTPSTSWQGQPYASSSTGACPPQAADPANVVCDHFTLDVQAPGTVTVSITWPDAADDFDLHVFEGGTEVASATSSAGTSESVTFPAGATTYEIRVVPVFVPDPSAYSGTASWAAAATGTACSPSTIELSLEPIATLCVGL